MRHRNLVFAAFLGLFAAFTVHAQSIEFDRYSDIYQADRGLKGGKKADPLTPQVIGRVTDFASRSVKGAEIRLIALDADEIVTVKSNAFGFYQVTDLTPGRTYFISVQHRRYLFVGIPPEVLIGDEPVVVNFEVDPVR
jgi:hypothetical protein